GATLRLNNGVNFDLIGLLDWDTDVEREDIPGHIDAVKTIIDQDIAAQGYSDAYISGYSIYLDDAGWVGGSISISTSYNQYLSITPGTYSLDKGAFASYFDSPTFNTATGLEDVNIRYWSGSDWTDVKLDLITPEYESADYFANGSLTVRTTAQIPDFPETAVIATVNRTQLNGGTAALTLTWADKTYRLNFTSDDLEPANEATPATGTLTITDGTGVVMEMNSSNLDDNTKITGVVKVDGE